MSSELFEVELAGEWEPLANHPDYIIAVDKPHSIVNQVTGRMVTEIHRNDGYVEVKFHGATFEASIWRPVVLEP